MINGEEDEEDKWYGKVVDKLLFVIDIQSGDIVQRARLDFTGAISVQSWWMVTRYSSRCSMTRPRSWCAPVRGVRGVKGGATARTLPCTAPPHRR